MVLAVVNETSGPGRADVQDAIAVIAKDFKLLAAETAIILNAIADRDQTEVRLDDIADGSPDVADRIRAALDVVIAYQDALDELRQTDARTDA